MSSFYFKEQSPKKERKKPVGQRKNEIFGWAQQTIWHN